MEALQKYFSNPLDLVLIVSITYLLYRIVLPSLPSAPSTPATTHHESYNFLPATHPTVLLQRSYTPKELAVYDGKQKGEKDGGRIMLAIERRVKKKLEGGGWEPVRLERTVFDVTAGRGFYGPDGPYGNFAGRDASRGMAKQSFDEDMLTSLDSPLDPLDNLSASEVDDMQGWHSHFSHKYTICGELVEDPRFAREGQKVQSS